MIFFLLVKLLNLVVFLINLNKPFFQKKEKDESGEQGEEVEQLQQMKQQVFSSKQE